MQLHDIRRRKKNTKRPQVGRGGKRGKTSGRGTKGQKARAGRKLRPELRDIVKRIPKMRGHGKNRNLGLKIKNIVVNLGVLDRLFEKGATVTPETLREKKLIRSVSGELPVVKILADGALTKALTISHCLVSGAAKTKIEKAGGTVAA